MKRHIVAYAVLLTVLMLVIGINIRLKDDTLIQGRIEGFRFVDTQGEGAQPMAFVRLQDGTSVIVDATQSRGCAVGASVEIARAHTLLGSRYRMSPRLCR